MLLISCIAFLHLKKQSHPPFLLTVFGRGITYVRPVGYSQNFPLDAPASHFLFLFWVELLRLYAFSQSHKISPIANNSLLFALPKAVLTAQVSVLSPSPTE